MIGIILRQRYLIKENLGVGGFGETYLAEYPQDLPVIPKYKCVVKRLIKPSTPETLERFKKEAAILKKLGDNHKQIPKLIDYFEENLEFYIVQEFIEGHDLSNEIRAGNQWREAEVIQLLQEILEVLAFVHQHNVIHRDIKPSNIMRRYSDGKLVLIDFGAFKEISTQAVNSQGQTSSTIEIGTRRYMPSEQSNGHPKLASDIYTVGIMAIEALTGLAPNQLNKDERHEVVWRDRTQVSDRLAEILTKMVRYDFRDRYADAAEALQALDEPIAPSPDDVVSSYPQVFKALRLRFGSPVRVIKPPMAVIIGDKWGYIDNLYERHVVIQPEFDGAENFYEELAAVKVGDKWGYIDQTGEMVLPPQFDEALSFSEELAAVKVGDKWGYIDQTGQIVIQPQFDYAKSFHFGNAEVYLDGNLCCRTIDKTGKLN